MLLADQSVNFIQSCVLDKMDCCGRQVTFLGDKTDILFRDASTCKNSGTSG